MCDNQLLVTLVDLYGCYLTENYQASVMDELLVMALAQFS